MSDNIAIIGSGPVSLFEALYQNKIGNKVTIYEAGNFLGGAWGVRNYEDGYELEIGCHIWDVDKGTYSFIESFIGEKLEALKPSPIIIIRNKKIPYDWKHNILIIKAIKHDIKAFISGKKFIKPLLKPRKYKYPQTGSKHLVEVLLDRISKTDITFKLNHKVEKINSTAEGFTLLSTKGKGSYNKVILTTFSDINSIDRIELQKRAGFFSHFHLIIKGELDKSLSYARLMDHPFIHRVSDITNYSSTQNPVFAVGVFKEKLPDLPKPELVEVIKRELVKMKWIKHDAKVLKFFDNDYATQSIDHNQINELNKIENLTILRSTNFIYSIGNNIERWKALL